MKKKVSSSHLYLTRIKETEHFILYERTNYKDHPPIKRYYVLGVYDITFYKETNILREAKAIFDKAVKTYKP